MSTNLLSCSSQGLPTDAFSLTAEVQQAAKTLFGTYLSSLSNHATLALVKDWEVFRKIALPLEAA